MTPVSTMYRRHLAKLARTRLDDVLLDEGVIDREAVEEIQAECAQTGRDLAELLFERELIDEWDLAKTVARHYSLPFVDVSHYSISREAEEVLPTSFCREHQVLVFDIFGSSYALAVTEMPSPAVLEQLAELSERTPFVYVALAGKIREILDARPDDSPEDAERMRTRKKAPAPAAEPAAPQAAARPARVRKDDLQPVSMRLGFTMSARIGPRGAAARPVNILQ